MPVLAIPGINKWSSDSFLKAMVVFFTVVLPGLILALGVLVYYRQAGGQTDFPQQSAELGLEIIAPSDLLEDKYFYKNKDLTIRGKVSLSQAVCERRACPQDDPCCGCRKERDLVIADEDQGLVKQTSWQLRLMSLGGSSLCQRIANSCDYACPGWELEAVYDVSGKFYAEPPPKGSSWQAFLDFYFESEEWQLVKRTNLLDRLKNIANSVPQLVQKWRGSGQYVLQ